MTENHARTPQRVLLTGAAGFVGKHLLAVLIERGHRVVALVHNTILPPALHARCERVLAGNICDSAVQEDAVRSVHIVCHASAYIPARMDELGQAVRCYQTNAQATLELGEAASKHGVKRFVQLSTGNMYAPSERACAESDSLFPTPYGSGYFASKLAAELYLTQIGQRAAMEVSILRVATPYGPGEPQAKVVPTFMRLAAGGHPLRVANGGRATFNFVYIDDVVDCVVKAIEDGPGGIYNIASGERTSLHNLAQATVNVFDDRKVALHIEPETTNGFAGFPPLSIAKARQTWGFHPRPLSTGLRLYRAHFEKSSA